MDWFFLANAKYEPWNFKNIVYLFCACSLERAEEFFSINWFVRCILIVGIWGDVWQGQECDVVIFSCVRTSMHSVGFVRDVRRMNVALTRARFALWIVGNRAALSQDPTWKQLIQVLLIWIHIQDFGIEFLEKSREIFFSGYSGYPHEKTSWIFIVPEEMSWMKTR